MRRYSTIIPERIRKDRQLTEQQFSVEIHFSPNAYPNAVKRGRMSMGMALAISRRFNIALDDLEDGAN